MNLGELCPIANSHGINLNTIKVGLFKALQTDEGSFDCFASAHFGVCNQVNCLWREDCFAAVRQN